MPNDFRSGDDYQQMKAAWHELYGGSVKHDHPSEEFSEGWTGGAQAAASADNKSCEVLHTADQLALREALKEAERWKTLHTEWQLSRLVEAPVAQERIKAALAIMDASSYGDPEVPFRMRAALTQPQKE